MNQVQYIRHPCVLLANKTFIQAFDSCEASNCTDHCLWCRCTGAWKQTCHIQCQSVKLMAFQTCEWCRLLKVLSNTPPPQIASPPTIFCLRSGGYSHCWAKSSVNIFSPHSCCCIIDYSTSVFTSERKRGGLGRNCNHFDLHLVAVCMASPRLICHQPKSLHGFYFFVIAAFWQLIE